MANITTRSKIAVRWTTNPANLGYDGIKTDWKNASPDVVTSPAKAVEYLNQLRSQMGGTYYAIHLAHKGVEISKDDLAEAVMFAEYQRSN